MKQIKRILPILLILITLIVSFLPVQIHADGEAWLANYSYRKQFTITGTADGIQTNYQLKLSVNRSTAADSGLTVYLDTKCEADFDDIRFTKADGSTELDFWIESVVGTVATVWVEFDSIPASPTTIHFYIYYGYAAAVSDSVGADTFIVFSDFESGNDGDTIGAPFTEVTAHVHVSTEQKYLGTRSAKILGGTGTNTEVTAALVPATGTYSIQLRLYKETATSDYRISHGNATKCAYVVINVTEDVTYYDSASATIDTTKNITADAWNLLELNNFDFTAYTYDIYVNSVIAKSGATMFPQNWANNVISQAEVNVGAGNDSYIDNFIVKAWTATEPTLTGWAAEEEVPSVILHTDVASGINFTAATVNGEITDMSYDTSVIVTFEYDTDSGAPYANSETADESPLAAEATVHFDLTGLADGQIYYYRVKAAGDVTGTAYGNELNFTTLERDPTVTTQAATLVTMDKDGVTGGTFNGNLTSMGDNAAVDVTFQYDTDSGAPYANETAPEEELAGTGAFTKAMSASLVPGQTYYYRSKAVGGTVGTVYGAEQSFTFTMPTFTTTAETIVTPGAATAQLNGNISNMQKASNVYAYFIWGYTNACIEGSTTPATLAGAGDFHDHITGFLRNVTVYYKAVLENHPTTSTGAAESFLIVPPALAEVLWYQPNDIIVNTDDDSTADGGSNATTIIDADRTEGNDFWNYALLTILTTTDGLAPQGETAIITDFIAASDELQFAALTDTVDVGDTYRVEYGTLPDRDSTQDGIITWGTDDGLAITYGGIGGGGDGDALTSSIDWWDMPESAMPSTWYANGENVASLPFYDNFSEVATQMGMPVVIFYFWFIIGLAFGTMLLLAVFTRSALLGVVGMNVVLFIGSSMTVIPMWLPFAILITQIGIMYLYKQVSY